MTQVTLRKRISGILVIFSLGVLSCSSNETPNTRNLKGEMLDVYQTAHELYTYVWSPKDFADDAHHERISKMLARLSSDFHNVQSVAPIKEFEPGFRMALEVQQDSLADIARRFKNGQKDYANWKLRGLTANCISCHSRSNEPVDFFGSAPVNTETSFNARLAAAEFLVASRQFDKGATELLNLATQSAALQSGSGNSILALKQWLIVVVRVKEEFELAAEALTTLADKSQLSVADKEVLTAWSEDLQRLAEMDLKANSRGKKISLAKSLLESVWSSDRIANQEVGLVNTLYATSLLHQSLKQAGEAAETRRASYYLAVAYTKIPINTLEHFGLLFLERFIRNYPETKEAKRVFQRYENELEFRSAGSGGVHLEPEDQKRLSELKGLAFGRTGLVVDDSTVL